MVLDRRLILPADDVYKREKGAKQQKNKSGTESERGAGRGGRERGGEESKGKGGIMSREPCARLV